MESSIYADLKKFSGKIEGKKVAAMNEIQSDAEIHKDTDIVRSALKNRVEKVTPARSEVTIDTIAMMVKTPLTPLRDANGFVYDASTLAICCGRGHIHKYFLNDITKDNGSSLKCRTCSTGNKFTTLVRETIETILGVPFALTEKRLNSDANYVEFSNPILKIHVACSRSSGIDISQRVNDSLLIKMHTTTGVKKIKVSLYDNLKPIIDTLPTETRERIQATKGKTAAARKKFLKEPLPYTPELAAINPFITQTQLNIITRDNDKLCLENC